jgi:tetratricopeptide (TPR) repeat protein
MVGGGVVAGLIVTAALLVPPQEMEACPSARDRVATVWDSPTRAKVRAAFLATGSPIAPDIFSRVEQALDGRLDSWVAAHREACVATKVRGEQSEAMLDLRMQCLERARRQIAALPAAWSTDIKLEAALPTTHAAGELDACADPESLAAPEPHPRDPQKVKLLEALQRQLDELPALHGAGRIGVALPLARESVVKARQMSVPSVLAEALEWNARFELDFGNRDAGMPMLYEAFQAANEAHDDARASDVSRWLLYYGVRVLKQKDQADILWSMAEAAVSRVPTRQDLRAELLDTQGVVLWDQGKHADAIDHVQRAIELHEKVSPGDDYGRASMLDHLSTALADQGETKEAIATGKRALYALESALGEVAPKVAVSLQNLSLLETSIGDYEAAARSAQRGLDIRSTLFPGDHPEVAIALANLANVRMQEERLEEAMDLFQRSADIREKALGSDNPQLATVRNHLAWLAIRVGDTAKARRMIDLVLPVKRKAYGDQHRSTAYAYGVLGMVLLQEGEPAAARAAHEKELAIKLGHGDDHSFSVEALRNLAFVALFEGKPQQAIVHLERARAVVEQGDSADQARRFRLLTVLLYLGRAYVEAGRTSDAVSALRRAVELADENGVVSVNDGARARFELARATWTSGDHTGAVELATEAHDVLSAGPGSELVDWITGRSEVKTIQDWLRRHRTR